ncbi:MAG: hypothetical protein ACOX6N_05430 [Patescibacteria group bacterium]|jgi:hypothetical protein
MDIPNLSPTNSIAPKTNKFSKYSPYLLILFFALATGFCLSRIFPSSPGSSPKNPVSFNSDNMQTENITPGVVYGDQNKEYSDTARGILKSGGVNGEGTHYLERDGGDSQKVALTSSSVDLDLFVDKTVEVNGQTNSSNKAGWFVDVFTIKIL